MKTIILSDYQYWVRFMYLIFILIVYLVKHLFILKYIL